MVELDKLAWELLAAAFDAAESAKQGDQIRAGTDTAPVVGHALAAIRAALLAAPPGWKLVPVEPTPMMIATFRADNEHGALSWMTHTALRCADFRSRYAGMLAAAPKVK